MRVALPYGTRPYALDLGSRPAEVLDAASLPEPSPIEELLARAMGNPFGSPLHARPGARVTLIVSDATRAEPRAAFIDAVRARLPGVRWTLAIATGTHGPSAIEDLGLPDDFLREATLVNHDGHRVELARPWFTVRARPASLVIASEALPVSASLYQAAKIAAASAPLVAPGGTLVMVTECGEGIGPLETVNEAIFRIGVLPRLPASARIVLVSDLSEAQTATTLVDYAPSVEAILDAALAHERALVLPHASHLVAEAAS